MPAGSRATEFFVVVDTTEMLGARHEDLAFLHECRDDDWSDLLAVTETVTFGAGDVVVSPGRVDQSLYLVTAGTLEVIGAGPNRHRRRVATIGPGSVFGEQAFFDGRPRSAEVRGVAAGELLRLDHAGFEALTASNPRLASRVLLDLGRVLSLRLRRAAATGSTRGISRG